MKTVWKAGGSVVRTATEIHAFVEHVRRYEVTHIVVSAPGETKREPKVTDALLAEASGVRLPGHRPVVTRMEEIALGLHLPETFITEMTADFTAAALQSTREKPVKLVSRGEYWTARMVAELLGEPYHLVEPTRFLRSDHNNSVDIAASRKLLAGRELQIRRAPRLIVPGFYIGNEQGDVLLLPRDGGNITAVAVAILFGCSEVVNVSHIAGIHVVDPAVLPNSAIVSIMTHMELRELAARGLARTLQEQSVWLARAHDIPIRVVSLDGLPNGGTRIVRAHQVPEGARPIITGIAIDPGYAVITVFRPDWKPSGDLAQLEGIYSRSRLNIEAAAIIHAAVSYAFKASPYDLDVVGSAIRTLWPDATITIEPRQAIVYVVGGGMKNKANVADSMFGAIGRAGVSITVIAQPATQHAIGVLVPEEDATTCVHEIYNQFFPPT